MILQNHIKIPNDFIFKIKYLIYIFKHNINYQVCKELTIPICFIYFETLW